MSEPNGTSDNNYHPLPSDFEEGPPGFVIYRGKIPFDELPFPNGPMSEDFQWASRNQELHGQYQGLVVAVHDRKVWGVGKTGDAAVEDAHSKPGCPAEDDLVLVHLVGMPLDPDETATSPTT